MMQSKVMNDTMTLTATRNSRVHQYDGYAEIGHPWAYGKGVVLSKLPFNIVLPPREIRNRIARKCHMSSLFFCSLKAIPTKCLPKIVPVDCREQGRSIQPFLGARYKLIAVRSGRLSEL